MKLLLDSCVWGLAKSELDNASHDVVWCGDWKKDPGDEEILSHALTEQRILVTLDKDFGELAILSGKTHCGNLRLVNFSARHQAKACLHALKRHAEELLSGAIVTVEPGRVRIRPPDNKLRFHFDQQVIQENAKSLPDDDDDR